MPPPKKRHMWRVCYFNINHVWVVSCCDLTQCLTLLRAKLAHKSVFHALQPSCQEKSGGHLWLFAVTIRICVTVTPLHLPSMRLNRVPWAIWFPWCLCGSLTRNSGKPVTLCGCKSRLLCLHEPLYQEHWHPNMNLLYTCVYLVCNKTDESQVRREIFKRASGIGCLKARLCGQVAITTDFRLGLSWFGSRM